MKKIILFISALTTILFIGCEDSDSSDSSTPALTTPTVYEFESRFSYCVSSVS